MNYLRVYNIKYTLKAVQPSPLLSSKTFLSSPLSTSNPSLGK